MSTIPTITTDDIRARVGESSFERGQQYFRRDAIFDARRQGMMLKARCEGSRPEAYRVRVSFGADGIVDAHCSCPVGGGGCCKHVAALLLTWREKPEEFTEVEELDAALERRNKAELIALIQQMLRRQPELETLLETPLPTAGRRRTPVNPETYRRQAAAVFRRAGHEWGSGSEVADGLLAITEIGDGFVEQADYTNAWAVYSAVIREVLDNFEMFHDEDGSLGEVVISCVGGLGECLAGENQDVGTRAAILEALYEIYRFDVNFGGVGLSDQVPHLVLNHATPEERRTVAGWVREALPQGPEWRDDYHRRVYGGFLLDLAAPDLDDESFLRICRETGRTHDLTDRLLSLGRLQEAIAAAQEERDYDLLQLADLFIRHGHDDVAERLILERSRKSDDSRILEWLKARYAARGDTEAALELAEKLFRVRPALERYQELRSLAGQLGCWERLRPEVLSRLDQPQHSTLLIQIYLDEGEIDRALAAVMSQPRTIYAQIYDYNMKVEVAQAAEATRPREALEIYQQEVENRIAQRGRGNYQYACQLLGKVRALYERLGESGTWTAYVTALREQNRSLRALKEEMAAARL